MAGRSYTFCFILLLLLLITVSNFAEVLEPACRHHHHERPPHFHRGHHDHEKLKQSECKPKCNYRCSATSHRKPCMFFCLKCCDKCLCVPPGTYGNKEVCPCYNNWKTKRGGPKCP